MNVIICGSKRYQNINFDKLVDGFDIIIRHNMLLPDNNYGKRNSDYQILNVHIYDNYIRQSSFDTWVSLYQEEYGITTKHLKSFYEYLQLETVKFHYFDINNTELMKSILKKHRIEHKIHKQLRCGIGSIASCISRENKPFLVGFGLQKESVLNKQFANKDGRGQCHDAYSEIDLIKKLHKANLIDATFCAIEDTQDIRIDSSLLTPTVVGLDIMRQWDLAERGV